MDLAGLLDATIGPPGRDDAAGAARTEGLIDALSPGQRTELLAALDCDQAALLTSRGERQAYLGPPVIRRAIGLLCSRQARWTTDLAFHALAACRKCGWYQGLGGVTTLASMQRDGVSFPIGFAREREFAALVNAFGDVGEDQEIRRAAHDLFGRIYIPCPVSSHDALNDIQFQRYLKRLVAGLHEVAVLREHVRAQHPDWYGPCSGQAIQPYVFNRLQPRLHPKDILRLPALGTMGQAGLVQELVHWKWWYAFRNPDLLPLDEAWMTRHADAYEAWEAAQGGQRWIEHLTPSLPATFSPALAALLGTATGAKPSARWIKKLKQTVSEREVEARAGVLAMLHRLGSAGDVRASELAWKDAGLYAFLHLHFRDMQRQGFELATRSLPDLLYLPWIKDGRTVLNGRLPPNPITLSEANTAFARGLAWSASCWRDEEVVEGLQSAAGGAMATIDLGDNGLRMRSLALFNACVWSLTEIASPEASVALQALSGEATDARACRSLTAALTGICGIEAPPRGSS